jgi:hypothetical protein
MNQHHVTYTVTPWSTGRWRAQIYVDGFPTDKAFFDSNGEGIAWCKAKVRELTGVMG